MGIPDLAGQCSPSPVIPPSPPGKTNRRLKRSQPIIAESCYELRWPNLTASMFVFVADRSRARRQP